MKSAIRIFACLMAASGMASAASVFISGWNDTTVSLPQNAGGGLANNTITAKIGLLANGTTLSSTSDFAFINAAWTNAGNIQFANADVNNTAGVFEGQVDFSSATLGLAGADVYLWITNGSNLNLVLRYNGELNFKGDGEVPNVTTLSLEESTFTTNVGSLLLGAYNDAGNTYVLNNSVPEPSALLLGALGMIGLVRRRR